MLRLHYGTTTTLLSRTSTLRIMTDRSLMIHASSLTDIFPTTLGSCSPCPFPSPRDEAKMTLYLEMSYATPSPASRGSAQEQKRLVHRKADRLEKSYIS